MKLLKTFKIHERLKWNKFEAEDSDDKYDFEYLVRYELIESVDDKEMLVFYISVYRNSLSEFMQGKDFIELRTSKPTMITLQRVWSTTAENCGVQLGKFEENNWLSLPQETHDDWLELSTFYKYDENETVDLKAVILRILEKFSKQEGTQIIEFSLPVEMLLDLMKEFGLPVEIQLDLMKEFDLPAEIQLDLMREFGLPTFDEYCTLALKILTDYREDINATVESAQTSTCDLLENLIAQAPAFHADKLRFLIAKNLHSYQMYPLAIKILEGKFQKTSPFSRKAAGLLVNCYGATGANCESFDEKKPFLEAAFKMAYAYSDNEILKHYAEKLFQQLCGDSLNDATTDLSDSANALLSLAEKMRTSKSTVEEVTERNNVLSEEKQQLEGENQTLRKEVEELKRRLLESQSDIIPDKEEQMNRFRLFQQRESVCVPKVAETPSKDSVSRKRSDSAPSLLQNASAQPGCTF